MSIKNGFNLMISLQGRLMTIYRPATAYTASVKFAPSNYSRNLEGPAETVIDGKEFVCTKDSLDLASYPVIKRGDKLDDPNLGKMTISEVRELYDLGGAIIGYRLRTS